MSTISLESSVTINEDIIARELDGETVILNLSSGTYFGLDPVGTRVWQLLESKCSLKQVFDTMGQEFEVDAAMLEADLLRLVTHFCRDGLVSQSAPEAGEK